MRRRFLVFLGVFAIACVVPAIVAVAQNDNIPRTPDGRPDLSGTYDTATLTPLQRPEEFGDRLSLTEEEASAVARDAPIALAARFSIPADRNDIGHVPQEAPPVGGDGSTGAAGAVGAYSTFGMDKGAGAFQINGQWRTSIITSPANGRQPLLTSEGQQQADTRARLRRPNTGTAWWFSDNLDAPGPYDDPELRPLAERCLIGFGSTSGPPMLPVLYNNLKKIVQTEDHVMIFVEMVHDARIVRMNKEHAPPKIRNWLGDSVGHWKVTDWWSTQRISPTPQDLLWRL